MFAIYVVQAIIKMILIILKLEYQYVEMDSEYLLNCEMMAILMTEMDDHPHALLKQIMNEVEELHIQKIIVENEVQLMSQMVMPQDELQ